jgi:hypothetical protein
MKCSMVEECPVRYRSLFSLIPTSSIIGNVSNTTGILMLNGENDTLLLQQGLTEVNHPDHTLITYPNLGHLFYPSSQWSTGIGPTIASIYMQSNQVSVKGLTDLFPSSQSYNMIFITALFISLISIALMLALKKVMSNPERLGATSINVS